jgi:hypothetical protein
MPFLTPLIYDSFVVDAPGFEPTTLRLQPNDLTTELRLLTPARLVKSVNFSKHTGDENGV